MNQIPKSELRHVDHIAVGVDRSKFSYEQIDKSYQDIKIGITRLAGGVVAFLSDGTWTAGSQAGCYSSPIEHNTALNFIVTLTWNEQASGIWESIKIKIADVVREHDLNCCNIHVVSWDAQPMHFHVQDVVASNDNTSNTDDKIIKRGAA